MNSRTTTTTTKVTDRSEEEEKEEDDEDEATKSGICRNYARIMCQTTHAFRNDGTMACGSRPQHRRGRVWDGTGGSWMRCSATRARPPSLPPSSPFFLCPFPRSEIHWAKIGGENRILQRKTAPLFAFGFVASFPERDGRTRTGEAANANLSNGIMRAKSFCSP